MTIRSSCIRVSISVGHQPSGFVTQHTSSSHTQAIVAEGHDPDEFLFGVDEKLVSPSKAKVEEKVELKDSEMASPDPDMTDLVVKDDTEDQEEAVTQEGRVRF